MKSESEFIEGAIAMIHSVTGQERAELGPDTDLQATEWFDSLLLISFLDFIETARGAPLPLTETGLAMEDLATIRTAYKLVIAAA
jgi:hypothetical protein